ncbi:MAG: HutP family protein [Clostridia bacterium]|nr:HutP family protein [Clostridia bacterium]
MEINMESGSRYVCKAAVNMALSEDRAEEAALKEKYMSMGIKAVAIDFGSDFNSAVKKVLERAVVASKREGLISDSHAEEGAVAGAAHEALQQIINKCVGLNLGGKIGIARNEDHISVCVFFAIGLLNLNDIAIGLGHRAI